MPQRRDSKGRFAGNGGGSIRINGKPATEAELKAVYDADEAAFQAYSKRQDAKGRARRARTMAVLTLGRSSRKR